MAREVSGHTAAMLAAAQRRGVRRGLLALAGACVLLVTVWALVLPGVTMANATFCGQEEHEHSTACYQQVLTCGFDDGSEGGSAASSGEFSSGVSDAAAGEQSASVGSGAAGEGLGEGSAAAASGAANSPDGGSSARSSSPDSSAGSAEGGASAVSEGAASAAAGTSAASAANAANAANTANTANAAAPDAPADAAVVSLVSDAVAAELPASSSAAPSSGHVHSGACYESVLVCEVTEHEHSLACYSDSSADLETEAAWEATLPADDDLTGNWAADVLAVADSQLGYKESTANYAVVENAAGTEVAKGYTRYGAWWGDAYGDWCAMFASFCLSYAGVPEEVVPQDANCQNWIEALSAEGVWLWRPVEAVENAEGVAQRTGVAVVPAEVVAVWEAEAAELAELTEETAGGEAAGDDASGESASANAEVDAAADSGAAEGEDASDASLEALLGGSSARYTALGSLIYDPQPGDLVFFDWDNDGEADHVGFVYELLDADGNVVAEASAPEFEAASSSADVESVEGASDDVSSSAADAAAEGADAAAVAASSASAAKLKTIEGNVSDGSADTVRYKEYDLTDSSILGYASLPENPETQVATLALDEPMLTSANIAWTAPTEVTSASTKDFIDLNLYDYSGKINANYNSNKKYPGFQWNGGAYMASGTFSRHKVDYIDFGNSNITDIAYGGVKADGGTNGQSKNAVIVANKGGDINKLDISEYGTTNCPIGMSTGVEALSRTLGDDGYPALSDDDRTSLKYLFTGGADGGAVTKKNTESIDGLFQKNETTGEYYYNSRWNHAQYDNNKFTLYNQIITPNFIVYPFGNFLPFNTITDGSKATQVSGISGNSGATVSDYVQEIIDDMSGSLSGSPTKTQLTAMLEKYQNSINGTGIKSSKQAIVDYFTAGGGSGDKPSSDTNLIDDKLLAKMYNIDWDEETNFFFGMDMTMNFMQPKGGLTGNDGQQPMEFYFTGDDDVWVYIDGVLFLDLTGIHRHVGGKIDFVNGKVYYYALDTNSGDVSSTPYKIYTFKELLEAAGKSTDGLNSKGAFKDYTTHQFKFYYMERGSGSSVCRMNFNFPLLEKNSISVSKEVENKTSGVLGNPDYKFQILKANADGKKTEELFIGAGVKCKIYDANDTELGTTYTDANGVFTLKAGQTAKFAEIPENAGKYYVRELFDSATFGQYGEVTVRGESTTTSNGVTVGSDTFTGVDSLVKDMFDGSTAFRFVNSIDKNKQLASLSITKKLEEYSRARVAEQFDIEVKLDDEPLPVGTEYTVTSEGTVTGEGDTRTRTVETAGIITIKPGETATIGNILAGTKFSVQETGVSAEGYAVTYTVDGESVGLENGLATGTLSVASEVNLVVTNSEKGASADIPGKKSLTACDGKSRKFEFELLEMTKTGDEPLAFGAKEGSVPNSQECSVENGVAQFSFPLDYALVDLEQLPAVRYYQVTEKQSEFSLANNTVYIFQVDIVEDASSDVGAAATVTKAWRGVMENGEPSNLSECSGSAGSFSADFTNILAGSLEISKTVEGTATGKGFEFEVALSEGKSGLETLPEYYDVEIRDKSGSAESVRSVKLKLVEKEGSDNEQGANSEQGAGNDESTSSKRVLKIVEASSSDSGDAGNSSGAGSEGAEEYSPITLKHDQRIIIKGIPYGTEWTVTEVDADGLIVQTRVVTPNAPSEGASAGEGGEGGEASGGASSAGSASGAEGSGSSANAGAGTSVASGETPAASSGESSTATVSGSIAVGSTQVYFTNTQMYQLPETGGAGVVVCVLAGLALVGAALLGMRRIHRRGEAV